LLGNQHLSSNTNISSTADTNIKRSNPSSFKPNDVPGRTSKASTHIRPLDPPACFKHDAAKTEVYKASFVVEAPSQNGDTELDRLITQSKPSVMEVLFDEDDSDEHKTLYDGPWASQGTATDRPDPHSVFTHPVCPDTFDSVDEPAQPVQPETKLRMNASSCSKESSTADTGALFR
jgi:hypothetical protein